MLGLGLGLGIGGGGIAATANPKPALLALASLWLEGDSGLAPASTGWTDQSTNAFVCAPAAGHNPTTSTTINGKPCLSCSGTTALAVPTAAWLGVKTIAVVAKLTALPGAGSFGNMLTLLDNGGTFTDFSLFNLGGYTNVTYAEDFATVTGAGYSPILDTNPHEYIATWDSGGNAPADYAMNLDGSAQTVLVSNTVARATNIGSIGARWDGAALGDGLAVDIAALIVFKSVLSGANRTALHAYLAGKYGI